MILWGFPCWWKTLDTMLRASGLGPISSVKLDGRKNIQYIKSASSVLHAEFWVLPPNRGSKTNLDFNRLGFYYSLWGIMSTAVALNLFHWFIESEWCCIYYHGTDKANNIKFFLLFRYEK